MTKDNSGFDNNIVSLKDEFCVWSDGGSCMGEYEVSEEYILPDYYPDIKKILLVKVNTEEGESFVQDGRAEYGGDVVFSVVYLGDSGQIKCVTRSYPYAIAVSLENIFSDSVIINSTTVKNRSVRAMSPRKLLLKGKAVTDVSVRNKICVSPRLSGSSGIEDEFTLERRTDTIDCVNYLQFCESDIRVSEDIEYKGKMPIKELVCFDAQLFASECRYTDGTLYTKGNARLFCLLACGIDDSDLQYELFEKNIPIEHTSEVKLPYKEGGCFAELELGAIDVGVANDSYGEPRILEVDLACRSAVTFAANEKTIFTDDVFSTAYEYENTYKTVSTERLVKCSYANFSSFGTVEIPKAEGSELERVVMSSAEADMSYRNITAGKAVFEGECTVKAVLADKNDGYVTTEVSVPLKYELNADGVQNCNCVCRCSVIDLRISLDGNKLTANVETGIDLLMLEELSANTVSNIIIDKSSPLTGTDEKVMILYYPESNENLWSVAKKYSVSRAALESVNNKNLSSELPRVLIIPSGG